MRAWTLTAFGDDRQYGGNIGYRDDPEKTYRYDSNVANSRQLSAGDLIFIRDRKLLTGIAIIENISSEKSSKVRQRCPVCNSTNIKQRHTRSPEWRCVNGHEFAAPHKETVPVTTFEAHYGRTYRAIPPGFPAARLKAAALRPNDQLAIEEVDAEKLEKQLEKTGAKFDEVFESAAQLLGLAPDQADDDADEPDLSSGDTREKVLRAIKMRRGQRKFRQQLARRYGEQCLISGCTVFAIVEAAHIWPYRGDASNNAKNGLLLRADVHTLFDLNLLGVNPKTLRVHLHPSISDPACLAFRGAKLRTGKYQPSQAALQMRWDAFTLACKTAASSAE